MKNYWLDKKAQDSRMQKLEELKLEVMAKNPMIMGVSVIRLDDPKVGATFTIAMNPTSPYGRADIYVIAPQMERPFHFTMDTAGVCGTCLRDAGGTMITPSPCGTVYMGGVDNAYGFDMTIMSSTIRAELDHKIDAEYARSVEADGWNLDV